MNRPRSVTLALLVLLFSPRTDALAQDDRDAREQRRVLQAELPDAEAAARAQHEEQARAAHLKELELARQLRATADLPNETWAELTLRLAELTLEEGRYWLGVEMTRFEEAQLACERTPGCDPSALSPDLSESRRWQAQAARYCEALLQRHPGYARADEALYLQAVTRQALGDEVGALESLTTLVKTYPSSPRAPEAYVLLGERYFDLGNPHKAKLAYSKVLAWPDHPLYPFAIYKLAWCDYNVGEERAAIEGMKRVVALSDKGELRDEALVDLVRFFADAGELEEAMIYFRSLGEERLIRDLLSRLAVIYVEQGKAEEAVITYRRLIAEDPNAPGAPDYQNEIIQAYRKIGKKEDTLAEIDKLRRTYGKTSAWARANATNQDAINEAMRFIEKNLRSVALDYHSEAKKLGTGANARKTYDLAYSAYSTYVEEFPSGEHAYEMRYAFGELLYTLKKFDEAYVQYMEVVKIDAKGQHSMFCAESAIFAAKEMVKVEEKEGKVQKADAKNKTAVLTMTDWEQKQLVALDQYAKLYPQSDKTIGVIYQAGYLFYNKNMFKEASERFRTVIAMNPKSKDAMTAANLILDSLNLIEDWSTLKEVAKAFYDQPNLGDAAFKKELYSVYERSSFKLIEETYKKDNDQSKAADAFMAFYNEFPTSEVGDLALNNAAAYYYNLKQRAKAMNARILLIEKFPKSKYYKDQVGLLGFDYESMGNFAEAANWYEKLFALDKDHANASDAIYSAALFRRALGESDKAVTNFRQYIAAYPTKDNVQQVRLDIAKIFEDTQKWDQAAATYLDFYSQKDTSGISPDLLIYARLRYGKCLVAQGQGPKAEKHYQESVEWFKKAKASGTNFTSGVEFVAEMMFVLAEKQFNEFSALEISGPKSKVSRAQEDKALTDSLFKKAKALQAIEATYADIINTGAGEWGLAALVRLGQAYENFGQALLKSYVPSYLTDEQRSMYVMGLEDKAWTQRQKAAESYRLALAEAWRLDLYTPMARTATERLGALRPEELPPLEESILEPRYLSAQDPRRDLEREL
ncbi:tetratricopeptide repeat protein [Myxococcota bacterium]|nr:tetratricopeptide repeat protein [Myxococcota bacterium]